VAVEGAGDDDTINRVERGREVVASHDHGGLSPTRDEELLASDFNLLLRRVVPGHVVIIRFLEAKYDLPADTYTEETSVLKGFYSFRPVFREFSTSVLNDPIIHEVCHRP
jgi:hypothetical protein